MKGIKKKPNKKRAYMMRKYILGAFLLTMIFSYSIINICKNYENYLEDIEDEVEDVLEAKKSIPEAIAAVEKILTDDAVNRMSYLEIYSYFHVLLDKEEIKNFSYIKDRNGNMNYAAFYRDRDDNIFNYALKVKELKDYAEAKGTEVIFVIPPPKYNKDCCTYSMGLPLNSKDRVIDELMFYLNRFEVPTLNYADYMPNTELSYDKVFYKTDHHWTVEASFEGTKILVDRLNEKFGYNLDGSYYLDEDNFTKVIYKDAIFGSIGRSTGACFTGPEDYEAYYPNWDMQFTKETLTSSGEVEYKSGGYLDTLIDNSVFSEKNLYKNWTYSMYLSGIRPFERITNLDNPDGMKIFMIRDSYFSPVIAFMAPMVSQIDAIWLLEEAEGLSIEEKLNEKYDCIIVEVYPYNIEEKAFRFFEENADGI